MRIGYITHSHFYPEWSFTGCWASVLSFRVNINTGLFIRIMWSILFRFLIVSAIVIPLYTQKDFYYGVSAHCEASAVPRQWWTERGSSLRLQYTNGPGPCASEVVPVPITWKMGFISLYVYLIDSVLPVFKVIGRGTWYSEWWISRLVAEAEEAICFKVEYRKFNGEAWQN